ncbi:MAG: hypothetical protein A3F11_07165 [Gammaproteobacteria bacterium RIFCSPHIGHO2_12_FULL_37_14]|nr:MAG: hypothetical protein A3F11_07165 [Gammaproteobacteria bacterium RIFCSPHIGHO2_12_FULL_37_14]
MKFNRAFITTTFFLSLCWVGLSYGEIPFTVMSNQLKQKVNNAAIIHTVESALKQSNINIGRHSQYSSAKIEVIKDSDNNSQYILVHLMSRYFLSYEIIRINLSNDGSVIYPVIKDYHLNNVDYAAQSISLGDTKPTCPSQYNTGKPLFVIGTPNYGAANEDDNSNSSTYQAVNRISRDVLKTHQYQLVQLLDGNATIKNYENILACPNLKYFQHIGGEDVDGESFFLYDGDFDASYFAKNPELNFSGKVISFDTCRAFDQVNNGFCPLITSMKHPPAVYTAGSSELLIFGSPETYACFWHKVLLDEAPVTKETLMSCARKNDPAVLDSHSGIYFIGELPRDMNDQTLNRIIIKTNKRTVGVPPLDYDVFKLQQGEFVKSYSIQSSDEGIVSCAPDPSNKIQLIDNKNLKSGEFVAEYDSTNNTCQYSEISRMTRAAGITRDIYGFYPEDSCFIPPQ